MSDRPRNPRNPLSAGVCGETGKKCFKSHEQAEEKVGEITDKPMRSYRCQFCGFYHITAQPYYKDHLTQVPQGRKGNNAKSEKDSTT